jgi:hypothetical protein
MMLDPVTIIFILFIIGIIASIYYSFTRMKKVKAIYGNQAMKRNGTVGTDIGYPTLRFTHQECPIFVSTYPGSKHRASYSRVHATVPNPQGHKLKIYSETIASEIGKAFGGQDIQIGNSDFDGKYMIKSNNEMFPAQLVTLQVQDKLLSLRKYHPTITLDLNQLTVNVPRYLKTEEDYDLLIDAALLCVDRLKTT